MSLFSKMNSAAGRMNASRRNALAAERNAIQQQRVNQLAATAANQQRQWQLQKDQATFIDRLEVAVEETKRLASTDPVAAAVRARTILSSGLPHPDALHQIEHKRALRQAWSTLESFWGALSPEGQADMQAFVGLSGEPPRLRWTVETMSAQLMKAEHDQQTSTRRARNAPRWVGGLAMGVVVAFIAAIVCVAVTDTPPPASRVPPPASKQQRHVPKIQASNNPATTLSAVTVLIVFAALVGSAIRWPLCVIVARGATKELEEARARAEGAKREEAAFWADPNRGVLLNAVLARSPGLRL